MDRENTHAEKMMRRAFRVLVLGVLMLVPDAVPARPMAGAGPFTGLMVADSAHAYKLTEDNGIFYERIANGGAAFEVYADEFLRAIPKPTTMIMLGIGGLLSPRRRCRRYQSRPQESSPGAPASFSARHSVKSQFRNHTLSTQGR